MRQELQGFLLIGASLGAFNLAVVAGAPGAAQAQSRTPGQVFRDCADVCPEMVVVPSGSFLMGSPVGVGQTRERPQRTVTFARPFAVGRFEVTFAEWDACVNAGVCPRQDHDLDQGADLGWGRDRRPVINVGWPAAKTYVRWLSTTTGQTYRLLSEAEWEYAARAGTTTLYSTGETITTDDANFSDEVSRTVPVGSYLPNAFGLYDMHGNVGEWVEDCLSDTYSGAPIDGSAWTPDNCSWRIFRGGDWYSSSERVRSANRGWSDTDYWDGHRGFRVARML